MTADLAAIAMPSWKVAAVCRPVQIDGQADDRLRNLRANARQHDPRAQQAHCLGYPQNAKCDLVIDSGTPVMSSTSVLAPVRSIASNMCC